MRIWKWPARRKGAPRCPYPTCGKPMVLDVRTSDLNLMQAAGVRYERYTCPKHDLESRLYF